MRVRGIGLGALFGAVRLGHTAPIPAGAGPELGYTQSPNTWAARYQCAKRWLQGGNVRGSAGECVGPLVRRTFLGWQAGATSHTTAGAGPEIGCAQSPNTLAAR